MNWFWIWIQKGLAEVIFGIAIILLIIVVAIISQIPRWLRQAKCRHEHFHETRACDAVCSSCGKNLGFIGTLRDARRQKP